MRVVLQVKNLSKYAVDSGKLVDVETLSAYTGSIDNIFNYDRNAEFTKVILDAVEAASKAQCTQVFFFAFYRNTFKTNMLWQMSLLNKKKISLKEISLGISFSFLLADR